MVKVPLQELQRKKLNRHHCALSTHYSNKPSFSTSTLFPVCCHLHATEWTIIFKSPLWCSTLTERAGLLKLLSHCGVLHEQEFGAEVPSSTWQNEPLNGGQIQQNLLIISESQKAQYTLTSKEMVLSKSIKPKC